MCARRSPRSVPRAPAFEGAAAPAVLPNPRLEPTAAGAWGARGSRAPGIRCTFRIMAAARLRGGRSSNAIR